MAEMLTQDFSNSEMACKCGCGAVQMDPGFMTKLQRIRELVGARLTVNSGYRCAKHNAALVASGKAAKTSQHMLGKAADIACLTSEMRYRLVKAALYVGMRGIGIDKNFVHLDDRASDVLVLWTYPL